MALLVVGILGFAFVVAPLVPAGALSPVLLVVAVGVGGAARVALRSGQVGLAYVFGGFATIWISYALLPIGLAHNWYGIEASAASSVFALFLISSLLLLVIITVLCLDQPLALVLFLGPFDVALLLLIVGTLSGHPGLFTAAAAALFVSVAVGAYLTVAVSGPLRMRQALPLGPRLLGDFSFNPLGAEANNLISSSVENQRPKTAFASSPTVGGVVAQNVDGTDANGETPSFDGSATTTMNATHG
jgi:succinate-acetate transporter protein